MPCRRAAIPGSGPRGAGGRLVLAPSFRWQRGMYAAVPIGSAAPARVAGGERTRPRARRTRLGTRNRGRTARGLAAPCLFDSALPARFAEMNDVPGWSTASAGCRRTPRSLAIGPDHLHAEMTQPGTGSITTFWLQRNYIWILVLRTLSGWRVPTGSHPFEALHRPGADDCAMAGIRRIDGRPRLPRQPARGAVVSVGRRAPKSAGARDVGRTIARIGCNTLCR